MGKLLTQSQWWLLFLLGGLTGASIVQHGFFAGITQVVIFFGLGWMTNWVFRKIFK